MSNMILHPCRYNCVSVQLQVAWYRLFGRVAAGSNVKVRLNDYYIQGCGDEVPAFRCELHVSGLVPGETYLFAVGAYTAEGKLVGGSVGASSRPILASHPLPILLAWAYIAQVSISNCFLYLYA